MNRIVFRLERRHLEPEGIEVATIDPYVDDVHLRDLAGEPEGVCGVSRTGSRSARVAQVMTPTWRGRAV